MQKESSTENYALYNFSRYQEDQMIHCNLKSYLSDKAKAYKCPFSLPLISRYQSIHTYLDSLDTAS